MIYECMKSLAHQTRPADEIIIVDNNCTDETIRIARKFDVIIIHETKQGIWAARSTGYDAATGDIIVCTDADARFTPNWLKNIESAFKNPAVIAVSAPGKFYDGPRFTNKLADMFYMEAFFLFVGLALTTRPLFGSNFAMRRTAWRKVRQTVHNQTEKVYDDIDLTYHLLPHGSIKFDRELYNYISIRPLRHPIDMLKRYRKGMHTIITHWPQQSPVRLYKELFR